MATIDTTTTDTTGVSGTGFNNGYTPSTIVPVAQVPVVKKTDIPITPIDRILSNQPLWNHSSLFMINNLICSDGVDLAKVDGLLDILVTNVSIGDITNEFINEYSGGIWKYTNGRSNMRQVDITFRSSNGLAMYTTLSNHLYLLSQQYPNSQKWNINIVMINNTFTTKNTLDNIITTPILNTNDAILINIGNIRFESSSKEVVTFTATFRFSKEVP